MTISCTTSLALPLSYTITGVTSSNLDSVSLTGSFIQPSQSITFNVVSGGGSTMTLTVAGYSISINIPRVLTTTVYNPPEEYRFYNTDARYVKPADSRMYSLISFGSLDMNMVDPNGIGEFFMYFDSVRKITGAYFQNKGNTDDFISAAYLYYSKDPLPTDKTLNNFKTLNYTRLDNTISSIWNTSTGSSYGAITGPFSTNTLNALGFRCEIDLIMPVDATVFKFTYKTFYEYPGFRFAFKIMGDGLITQLIAPDSDSTLTVPSYMSSFIYALPHYASSKIVDVSCNNTYYYMGYNNGGVVTSISGNVGAVSEKRFINTQNGCLRSYIRWVPNNLFASNHKLTIMCWVYLTAYQDYDTIAGFDNGSDANGLSFGMHNGYLKLRMKTTNYGIIGAQNADGNMSILSLNTWYHVCATVSLDVVNNHGKITYYVNGVNQGTYTETYSWNNVNTIPVDSTFYVGKYEYLNKNATSSAKNRINYLRLYNNELSESDILSLK